MRRSLRAATPPVIMPACAPRGSRESSPEKVISLPNLSPSSGERVGTIAVGDVGLEGAMSSLQTEKWPSIGEGLRAGKGAQRRLTMIPQKFSEWCMDASGYCPTTKGGQECLRLQREKEIKDHLFSEPTWVSDLRDFGVASEQLEESIEKMLSFAANKGGSEKSGRCCVGEEGLPIQNSVDSRFDHSWTPKGPGLGWVWIPRGCLKLDCTYPASKEEIRRFGHSARKVHPTKPPPKLTKTYAAAVKPSFMAQPNRQMGKRRQDEWMEEDDLLGGDLGQAQDLRSQIQKGGRNQVEPIQVGFKGRRLDQGHREVERFGGGRNGSLGRWEQSRPQGQQGGWSHSQQGNWTQQGWKRGDRRPIERFGGLPQSDGSRSGSFPEVKCFRCLGTGHHQSECENEPVCYKCKQKGHMAVDCRINKKLRICGFGIPGQGFYSIDIPETKVKINQATGFITVLEGNASEDKIDQELKNLVRGDWDFRVKQTEKQEYMVVFPDKNTLWIFHKLSEFEMPLFGLKGVIEVANVDPESSSILHTVWVQISNIPPSAKDVESVKEIAMLVVEPIL